MHEITDFPHTVATNCYFTVLHLSKKNSENISIFSLKQNDLSKPERAKTSNWSYINIIELLYVPKSASMTDKTGPKTKAKLTLKDYF